MHHRMGRPNQLASEPNERADLWEERQARASTYSFTNAAEHGP